MSMRCALQLKGCTRDRQVIRMPIFPNDHLTLCERLRAFELGTNNDTYGSEHLAHRSAARFFSALPHSE